MGEGFSFLLITAGIESRPKSYDGQDGFMFVGGFRQVNTAIKAKTVEVKLGGSNLTFSDRVESSSGIDQAQKTFELFVDPGKGRNRDSLTYKLSAHLNQS